MTSPSHLSESVAHDFKAFVGFYRFMLLERSLLESSSFIHLHGAPLRNSEDEIRNDVCLEVEMIITCRHALELASHKNGR